MLRRTANSMLLDSWDTSMAVNEIGTMILMLSFVEEGGGFHDPVVLHFPIISIATRLACKLRSEWQSDLAIAFRNESGTPGGGGTMFSVCDCPSRGHNIFVPLGRGQQKPLKGRHRHNNVMQPLLLRGTTHGANIPLFMTIVNAL